MTWRGSINNKGTKINSIGNKSFIYSAETHLYCWRMSFVGPNVKCCVCSKTVYAMERYDLILFYNYLFSHNTLTNIYQYYRLPDFINNLYILLQLSIIHYLMHTNFHILSHCVQSNMQLFLSSLTNDLHFCFCFGPIGWTRMASPIINPAWNALIVIAFWNWATMPL